MPSFVRTALFVALAALVLGGCQMSKDKSQWTRAQRAVFVEEGFAETDRGWEFSINDRLLFATDESVVVPPQVASIRRISGRLLAVGIRHAAVEGHADGTGSAEHNQRLSERRAAAVAEVLVTSGFARSAVTTLGLGDRYPVESNATAAGRRENRRVVILITAS